MKMNEWWKSTSPSKKGHKEVLPIKSKCGFENINNEFPSYLPMHKWDGAMYSLIGMALGDSLGAVFEMKHRKEIMNMWTPHKKYPRNLMPCGLVWTDDTQMCLSFIDSIIRTSTIDENYIRYLWLELSKHKWFEEKGETLKGPYQYGGFRGTGGNFRSTIDTVASQGISQDVSRFTAGNGASMRITPIAIYCWKEDGLSMEKRIEKLEQLVIKTSGLTHHDILGVAPAFALGYLLLQWIGPPPAHTHQQQGRMFFDETWKEQLKRVANATREFESKLAKNPFFYSRNGFSAERVHLYSDFLKSIVKDKNLSNHELTGEDRLLKASDIIINFCNNHTQSKPISSMNDGFAPASVTASILTALFLKDKPFLGVLQHLYYYGADTDTVGAMVGSLLGAFHGRAGNADEEIPKYFINQIICYKDLLSAFLLFIDTIVEPHMHLNEYFDWIKLEKKVTRTLMSVPDGSRNPHYNSVHSTHPIPVNMKLHLHLQQQIEEYLREEVKRLGVEGLYVNFRDIYDRAWRPLRRDAADLTSERRMKIFQAALFSAASSAK